jgi:hypothetical protein
VETAVAPKRFAAVGQVYVVVLATSVMKLLAA